MEDIVAFLENLGTIAEGAALLASLVFYIKYKHTALKYLPFLLSYLFLLELFGVYLYHQLGYNNLFYNILNVWFYGYFLYVFYSFLNKPQYKTLVGLISIGYVAALGYDLWYYDIVTEALLISYITGGCCIIICVVLYFLEMLNSPRVLSVRQDLMFWFGIGLLLFYVGYIPIKITRLAFSTTDNIFMFLKIMHYILIVILYGSITAGLVWKKRN